MISFLPIATVTLGFCSVAFALPQVIKLHRLKDSSSFSLTSWTTWLIYQLSSVAYSLAIHAWVFTAINIGWSLLYVTMVTLIIFYRQPKRLTLLPAEDAESDGVDDN